MYRGNLCDYLCIHSNGEYGGLQEDIGRWRDYATGSASCDFEADLIVWRGSFYRLWGNDTGCIQCSKK